MLIKPILLPITSFDATKDKIFSFNVPAGGSQVVANRLTIRNQSGNAVIYSAIQNSFKYSHILPAKTLANGGYYNATIQTLDSEGKQSAESAPIQFRCYSQPTLTFTNMPVNQIVNNSSFEFTFRYNQKEGERLNSYIVNLYNSSEVLISSSKNIFVENGTPPYDGSYLFMGFEDRTSYYVEVVAQTINKAVVKTDLVKFQVKYEKPNAFTILELQNNCEEGYIAISSNISIISGETNPPGIKVNGEIDLRGDERYLSWKQGYSINENFLTRVWFRDPVGSKAPLPIVQFSNIQGQTITIAYAKGYKNVNAQTMQSYIQVYISNIEDVDNNNATYYIFSNYIDTIPTNEYYVVQLRMIDGIGQVELQTKKDKELI